MDLYTGNTRTGSSPFLNPILQYYLLDPIILLSPGVVRSDIGKIVGKVDNPNPAGQNPRYWINYDARIVCLSVRAFLCSISYISISLTEKPCNTTGDTPPPQKGTIKIAMELLFRYRVNLDKSKLIEITRAICVKAERVCENSFHYLRSSASAERYIALTYTTSNHPLNKKKDIQISVKL